MEDNWSERKMLDVENLSFWLQLLWIRKCEDELTN
jgi:hypothetical protein